MPRSSKLMRATREALVRALDDLLERSKTLKEQTKEIKNND